MTRQAAWFPGKYEVQTRVSAGHGPLAPTVPERPKAGETSPASDLRTGLRTSTLSLTTTTGSVKGPNMTRSYPPDSTPALSSLSTC